MKKQRQQRRVSVIDVGKWAGMLPPGAVLRVPAPTREIRDVDIAENVTTILAKIQRHEREQVPPPSA